MHPSITRWMGFCERVRFMSTRASFLASAVAAVALPGVASAALFSDNFDTDTSSNFTVNRTSTDTLATFSYDYSADSIPSAPNSTGGTTRGLKLEANIAAPTGKEAITVAPNGQSFSGAYRLNFDMWINANGPFPGGGTGSTEYLTAGVGYNGTTVNNSGTSGSGTWFAANGEGGASGTSTTARDFMAYNNSGAFIQDNATPGVYAAPSPNAQDNFNEYYTTEFIGMAPPEGQTAASPVIQIGTTNVGTLGFRWIEVEIAVDGSTVTWTLNDPTVGTDGLLIATITNAASTTGNISLGYNDIFSSLSANPEFSFGLIDNVVVSVVPEPASLSLLGLAGLAVLRRRRA